MSIETDRLRSLGKAVAVAMAFWSALANDDDAALEPLLSATWADRPAGFATLYRTERELAPETCRVLGLVSTVYDLGTGRIRLLFSPVERAMHFTAGQPQLVWRLELVQLAGNWFVDRSTDLPAISEIDLSLFLESAGVELDDRPLPVN